MINKHIMDTMGSWSFDISMQVIRLVSYNIKQDMVAKFREDDPVIRCYHEVIQYKIN